MKAIFSPGPSYRDSNVKTFAGWWHIQELYRQALEELGFNIFIPEVLQELVDDASTVSKILSYDVIAASQLPLDVDLFMGPPGYSLAQILRLRVNRRPKIMTWVWNNADWWRDEQLKAEYAQFNHPYDLSPTWRWINKIALELSDRVLACSPFVKKTHARIVPEEKIAIAFWGVDSQRFTPASEELPGFRILFVGGDPIRKGLPYLLEAMKPLISEPDVELWIVGPPRLSFTAEFQTDRVKQLGLVPHEQMPELYRQCHIICIPTLEDGIALAIQEGMASGLVPIGSPDIAEVFEDGVSGFKVDFRDVEGIKSKLEWLKRNPITRRGMAQAARRLAESQTWEETKNQVKKVIKEVVGNELH